ncbi:MAG: tetratricopeptide repeat protein [bacterium]|nr:tetratricopeptide repeat protein [bacterium]
MTKSVYLSKILGVALLAAVLGPACLTPPARMSSAQSQDLSKIKDPVKYQKAQEMVNAANRLYLRKRYPEALKLARESIEVHETFEGHYLIGTVLYQQNKTEESLDAYLKSEALNPTDQQLLLTIGTVYTALGDLGEAQKRYLRLHETYPEDPVYSYKVGTTYKNLRDYEKADTYLKKAEVKGFKHLDQVYMQLGDVALELKQYEASEEYFKKARAINPKLKDAAKGGQASRMAAKLEEGNTAFRAKDYDTALVHFNAAKKLGPGQAAPFILSGSTYLVTEKYDLARKDLLKATELNPADPKGYSLLGSAYHKQKNYRSALSTFERGLKVAPESFEMLNKQGLVLRDREETSRAIDSFSRAVRIQPDYLPARLNLAYTLLDDRRYVDARREFETAQKIAPKDSEVARGTQLVEIYTVLDRGDRFFKERRFSQALTEYRKALKIRSDIPIVYNSLGQTEIARKKYSPAEGHYKKALTLDANNIPALQGLLRVYSVQRKPTQERETLARLQKLTRNDITAAITLGRIKEDAGKLAEAEKYYLGLMKSNPDAKPLKRRLGYVYYKQGLALNKRENYKGALGKFEKAEKFNPEIPQLPETLKVVRENIQYASLLPRLKKAERLFSQARYREALPLYERVYKELKRPLILVKIANCHISLGDEQKGLAMLENAEKESPAGDVEVSEAIYNYLLQKGKVDRARAGFQRIVETHEDAYYSWYKLGVIDLMKKEPKAAVTNFNRSVIYKPDFAVGYIARGVALYETGAKDRARLEFEEALKRDREAVLASFNIGVLFYNEDMLDKAKKIFLDLAKEFPEYCDPRYQLSYIYFREGDLDAAEKEVNYCLKRNEEARFHWALAQIRAKRYEKTKSPTDANAARAVYRDIIAKYPTSSYTEESRQALRKISPDSRIVQPYALRGNSRKAPLLYNGNLLLVEVGRLVAYDSSGKKERWSVKTPSPVVDIYADHLLHVLSADGKVSLYELSAGARLAEFQAPAGARYLTGSYNRIGVGYLSGKGAAARSGLAVFDRSGSELARYADAPAASRFHSLGGSFLRVDRVGNNAVVNVLPAPGAADSGAGSLKVPFARLRALPQIEDDGRSLYLFAPGDRVAIVNVGADRKAELAGRVTVPRSTARVELQRRKDGKTQILVPAPSNVTVYDTSGKQLRRIALPKPLASQFSLRALPDDRLLYLGTDGRMRSVDFNGKEQWQLKLPTTRARTPRGARVEEAYSIYY